MALTGGCMCGTVRYSLASEPFDAGWCHCRTCQLFSGAPAVAFATVSPDDFKFTSGSDRVKRVRSSNFGSRQICGECGTALTIEVDFQPETVDFAIATLDEPGRVRPGFHIFTRSRIPWFDTNDDLPRYEAFRPNTRGLEGTEPPE
jgi:hypothetical protein